MVDLAKIRKKAKKALADAAEAVTAAAESSGREAVSPPASAPLAKGGVDAARPAGEDAGAPPTARGNESTTLRATETPADEVPTTTKLERFKEQAGRRRETHKAEEVVETSAALLELLTFRIADEQYAVDIERIVEIVTPRPLTRIPNAGSSVLGIISLRGTIVTLVDVRRRLGHSSAPDTADTRIVVFDFRNETVGFVVDRVQRVVKVAASAIEPHPVVHSAELQESIRGVFRVADALTILLDLDKLLDHTQWT